ncbi:hypothetical protein ACNO7T_04620 [Vibrio campbellii]
MLPPLSRGFSIAQIQSAPDKTKKDTEVRNRLFASIKSVRNVDASTTKRYLAQVLKKRKSSHSDLDVTTQLEPKMKCNVSDNSGVAKRHERNNKEWAAFQQQWQDIADRNTVNGTPPEAMIRFNYRYVVNDNTTGLKYDPIHVDNLLNDATKMENVYYLRQINDPTPRQTRSQKPVTLSNCETKILPKKNDGTSLIVPSVGMPEEFKDVRKLQKMYWYHEAENRPVYLFVHQSELDLYDRTIGDKLRSKGIGLIGWEYPSGQVGFGATRKAAVEFSTTNGFNKAVMMDCNVAKSDFDLISTAERATSAFNDASPLYIALGASSGDTHKNAPKSQLVKKKDIKARPVEQLTMWNNKVQFDPAFITSSEDIDASNDMKFFSSINKEKSIEFRDLKLQDAISKEYPRITKIKLTPTSKTYRNKVERLLSHISASEKNIVVRVKTGTGNDEKTHDVTLDTLSEYIAVKLDKDKAHIQSLIIEKMLLKYSNSNSPSGYQFMPSARMSKTISKLNEEATNKALALLKRKSEGATTDEQLEYSKRPRTSVPLLPPEQKM